MIFLILFLIIPIITGTAVYTLYRNDLYHARGTRKLKRGAIENLVTRHQRALYIHLAIFVVTTILSLILIGRLAFVIVIPWLIIFMGHISAFNRFSQSLKDALSLEELDTGRLVDKAVDSIDLDEDVSQQSAEDYR